MNLIYYKQQIRKKNNSNLLISFNSCMKELCVSNKSYGSFVSIVVNLRFQ